MTFSSQLRAAAGATWEAQHAHPFVRGIGDGTLAEERFRFYIRQDYVFLVDYGRLLALGAARAPRLSWSRGLARVAHSVLEEEMSLHRALAARWGVSSDELEATRPVPATRAYVDDLLRVAALHDFAELTAALLPCMWGYSEIGTRLAALDTPGGGHAGYAEWIAEYASPEFAELAAWSRELVDEAAAEVGPPVHARMHTAFETCSELELAFWESAWRTA